MENQELIFLELEELERFNQIDVTISQNLENFIEYVAKTGTYIFPWNKIKKLYLRKINQTIENFQRFTSIDQSTISSHDNISLDEMKTRILDRMKTFHNAPFTIQRISELLLKPQYNYTRLDKFLRGLEKCVMVVTTIDPQGNKIFTESMMNGIDSSLNGSYHKTYNSLQIETATVTSEVNVDKIKLVKQSKIDISEIEIKLPISDFDTKYSSLVAEDIEFKNSEQENKENNNHEQNVDKNKNNNDENDDDNNNEDDNGKPEEKSPLSIIMQNDEEKENIKNSDDKELINVDEKETKIIENEIKNENNITESNSNNDDKNDCNNIEINDENKNEDEVMDN